MYSTSYGMIFAGGLFFGMLVCLETGRRIGNRRRIRDPEGARQGVAAVEGADPVLVELRATMQR